MSGIKVTGLGQFRLYDADGNIIMEGQMREAVFEYGDGHKEHIKAVEPKKCPNCGAELK